jgi:hypothetical protein
MGAGMHVHTSVAPSLGQSAATDGSLVVAAATRPHCRWIGIVSSSCGGAFVVPPPKARAPLPSVRGVTTLRQAVSPTGRDRTSSPGFRFAPDVRYTCSGDGVEHTSDNTTSTRLELTAPAPRIRHRTDTSHRSTRGSRTVNDSSSPPLAVATPASRP